jgi:hypothetical protein
LVADAENRIATRNAVGWETCLERLAGRHPGDDAWRPRFDHYVDCGQFTGD